MVAAETAGPSTSVGMTILLLGWGVSRFTCFGITELSSRPKWRDLLFLFPIMGSHVNRVFLLS